MISKICWICFAHPSSKEPTGSVYTLRQTKKIPLKVVIISSSSQSNHSFTTEKAGIKNGKVPWICSACEKASLVLITSWTADGSSSLQDSWRSCPLFFIKSSQSDLIQLTSRRAFNLFSRNLSGGRQHLYQTSTSLHASHSSARVRQNAEAFAFWTFEPGYNCWSLCWDVRRTFAPLAKASVTIMRSKITAAAATFSIVVLTVFRFCPFCLLLWLYWLAYSSFFLLQPQGKGWLTRLVVCHVLNWLICVDHFQLCQFCQGTNSVWTSVAVTAWLINELTSLL